MSSTLAMAASVKPEAQVHPKKQTAPLNAVARVTPLMLLDGVVVMPLVPTGSKCPQWFDLAMQFFPVQEWNTIDFLLNRESRCDLEAFNGVDTNGMSSYSLFQINAFWCRPNKYYKLGFLQEKGVLSSCQELFNPHTQFRAARAIFVEGLVRHGQGWRSWGNYPETR